MAKRDDLVAAPTKEAAMTHYDEMELFGCWYELVFYFGIWMFQLVPC